MRRCINGIVDETLFFIASCVRIHQKKERLLHYARGSRLVYSIRFKALLGKLFDHSPDSRKWYKRCERWQSRCSCPNSKYVSFSCGRGHYFGELYRRDHIFPVKEHVFEGRQYFIPNRPEHLLTKLYGKNYLIPDAPASREKHCVVEWSPGADT